MKQTILNENRIFNKIAEINKFEHCFSMNVKSTKLNTEIIDSIFKEFSFKYINKKSSTINFTLIIILRVIFFIVCSYSIVSFSI